MTEQPVPKEFRKGDHVEWDSSQGARQGHVIRKQTSPTQIKGHNVKASKENPHYIVESDKSGKRAATSRVNSEDGIVLPPLRRRANRHVRGLRDRYNNDQR